MSADAEFLADFEAHRIPHEEWKHASHIRMAYLYLRAHPYDEALRRVRDGIQALNALHGDKIPKDQVDRGYHETMTVAWVRLVAAVMRQWGTEADFDAFAAKHPHLVQKTLMRLFYSRERMMTWEAKRTFVEPDLLALPPLGP